MEATQVETEARIETPQPSNLSAPVRGTVTEWQAPVWDKARRELARKMVCPPATTDDEFDFFMAWCARTGLDPFIQQAYLVPRKQKDARGNYVEKMQPQASVAGMAARADTLPDYRGMRSGIVYAGDEFMVDENCEDPKTAVIHRWSLEGRIKAGGPAWKTKPLGAWAHAQREGRAVPVTFLSLAERMPSFESPFWSLEKAPAQLRKCSEAESYRKAFPNIFGGVYIGGELEHAEREVNAAPPAASSKAPDSKSAALAARLGVKPVEKPKTVEAAVTPPGDTKASVPGVSIPLDQVRFGPHKGSLIADLSTLELEASISFANQQLANATGKERWIAGVREGIGAIVAEVEKREGAEPPVEPAEPGSEG